jgi:hypothetical protein
MRMHKQFTRSKGAGSFPALGSDGASGVPPVVNPNAQIDNVLIASFLTSSGFPVQRVAVTCKGPSNVDVSLPAQLWLYDDLTTAWYESGAPINITTNRVNYFDVCTLGDPSPVLRAASSAGSISAMLIVQDGTGTPSGEYVFAMSPDLISSSAAGDVTSAGVSGDLAQAVQGVPGGVGVNVTNAPIILRDAFESFNTQRWTIVTPGNAIIDVEGNTASASYLNISLDPLVSGQETLIESVESSMMPFELSFGLSASQRSDGQVMLVEAVSTDTDADVTPLTPPSPIAITSAQQATTTLTITTATPHGLLPGQLVTVYGVVSDSRLNYPSLTVASIPTPTSFTCTAGPFGTIPSVTAGPFAGGFILRVDPLGSRRNGASLVLNNTTATNGSFYTRSEGGTSLPSGTIAGNHNTTIATTASVQLVNTPGAYAFAPSSQFTVLQQVDSVEWLDQTVDASTALPTVRYKRNQVVPNPARKYDIRIRAGSYLALSAPVAQIVTSTKSGSTTATVVTDVPHGLTTGDQIVIYGNRDQVAFANLTAATAVASVVNATTFTIAYGTSVTLVTQSGYVARVNGGRAVPGIVTQVVQSIVRAANVVTVTGNAAWAGILIGDLVNLVGVRDTATGATIGIDGAYRVQSIATTTLILESITNVNGIVVSPTGPDIASVNCGGAVLRRTDMRLHYIRAVQRAPVLIEPPYGRNDQAMALPVSVTNTPSIGTVTTVTTVGTLSGGGTAEDAATTASPVIVGGVVRSAVPPITFAAGDAVRDTMTSSGAKVIKQFTVPEAEWSFTGAAVTNTADVVLAATAGASLRRYITGLQVKNTNATPTEIVIKDGATIIWRSHVSASMLNADSFQFAVPLKTSANAAINFACITTGANVYVAAQGFTAP